MNKDVVEYFKALSNPVRLDIFLYVVNQSDGKSLLKPSKESCVTEIARALGIPQPTVSNHLRVLKKSGLVKSNDVDTHCYQYVTKDAASNLTKYSQYVLSKANSNPF